MRFMLRALSEQPVRWVTEYTGNTVVKPRRRAQRSADSSSPEMSSHDES